jgi:integrase-like protein
MIKAGRIDSMDWSLARRSPGSSASRLGLPHLTLHELRHTYATTALRAGVHPKIVSARLGHATVAFTLDTYTADVPELDQAAAQEISNLFLNTPGFGSEAAEITAKDPAGEPEPDETARNRASWPQGWPQIHPVTR